MNAPSSSRPQQVFLSLARAWLLPLLALNAGLVDAACFVGILQVFTAHVTGNFAALASVIIHADGSGGLRVCALVAFCAGVASAWLARPTNPAGKADPI